MRRLGLIGAGAIAETVLATLAHGLPARLDHLSILVLSRTQVDASLAQLGGRIAHTISVRTEIAEFLADAPDVVVECAGHAAVRQFGATILESGRDLILASVGALADDQLRTSLEHAAARGGARLILPAGAIGGVDVLVAARYSGLESVVYTGRKPPRAWLGTPADRLLDLMAITAPIAFFEGTAREAARDYPQNANVAATIALAGAGFDATRVRLIADPTTDCNIHEVAVRSACANFTIKLGGRPSPSNPKSSLTAGFSVARQVLNRVGAVVI